MGIMPQPAWQLSTQDLGVVKRGCVILNARQQQVWRFWLTILHIIRDVVDIIAREDKMKTNEPPISGK